MTSRVMIRPKLGFMRAGRLVELLSLLQAQGRMTAAQLAAELEVSQRTILRDIAELSAAGFPVYAIRGSIGGFELLAGSRLDLPAGNPKRPAPAGRAVADRARIRLSPHGRQLAALNGRLDGLHVRRPGRRLMAQRAGWLEAWLPVKSQSSAVAEILAFGAEAEVVEPAELRDLVRLAALQIAELHRTTTTPSDFPDAATTQSRSTPVGLRDSRRRNSPAPRGSVSLPQGHGEITAAGERFN
jgi:predicted DNA-binding transcriptional regulator YafY